MGASVSLPGPFAQFSRLSLSDVDEMIIRHRTQLDGAFMVTPQELEAIVGPKVKDAAAIIAQLEAGEEGKINALSFLCGAVAFLAFCLLCAFSLAAAARRRWRPPPPPPVVDRSTVI